MTRNIRCRTRGVPAVRIRSRRYYWLNGPLARQLGIDFGQGLIAFPVNHVIGRTMSLIERNIAGYQIKLTQVVRFGKVTSLGAGRRRRVCPADWLEA